MKDILVMATGSAKDKFRFDYAEQLADAFDASLDIVLVNELPSPKGVAALPLAVAALPLVAAPAHSSMTTAAHEAALALGAEREAAVKQHFAAARGPVTVTRIDDVGSRLAEHLVGLARTRDTFVCALGDHEHQSIGSILDKVLIESGRSVIGVPQGYVRSRLPARHVAIAWSASRESVRAVAEAMPLLKHAEDVVVLLVDQLRQAGKEERPGDDILQHLARHGIKANPARVAKEELKTSEAMLAEAKLQGADLLVVGADPTGGLRHWLRGRVSRDLVSKADMPLFIAH